MGEESAAGRSDPEAVARRVARERTRLGLSEHALAGQAAMSPRYLRHLMDAGPDFDPGGFVRIAAALGLTYRELVDGRGDRAAGQAGPQPRPVLVRLTTAECWDLLGTHGVGHLALPADPAPAVFPVNFAVDAGTVVHRTAPGGAADRAAAELAALAEARPGRPGGRAGDRGAVRAATGGAGGGGVTSTAPG